MLCRQIYDENDDDENVPLNYYITNDLRIQFGRDEFCLVIGLRFGVENWEEYDSQENLPFRRRVFPSHLDGQPITGIDIENAISGPTFAELYDDDAVGLCCLGILQLVLLGAENRRIVPQWLLRIANDRVAWNKYPWGSYVWPTLYSQLRNANVRRWSQFYVEETTNENDAKTYSLCGYTWAFKGNIPAARLTPDDNEARSDWWISSKAYFDGFIDQVKRVPFDLSRQNMHVIPSNIYRQFVEQKNELERNKKDVDDIKEEMKKFREEMNSRPVRQENTVPIIVGQHYGLSNFSEFRSMQMPKQSASHYWRPSSHPGSYYSFGQPPSHMVRPNLQTTIETQHDVEAIVDQNISNRGKRQQVPSKYLVTPFTVQALTTMGYNEEENNVTFFGSQFTGNILFSKNVDPAKVRRGNYENILSDMQSLSYGTPNGWLGKEVFLPIHVAENHWATGVIDLANSHFYVFDSLASEENKDDLQHPKLLFRTFNTSKLFFRTFNTSKLFSRIASRNAECSNCKHLRRKISVLKATLDMHMHPEQHTVNSAALFHEVLNEMEKLNLE
ncbi:phospholipase-like protein [Tanacetum coccineum]